MSVDGVGKSQFASASNQQNELKQLVEGVRLDFGRETEAGRVVLTSRDREIAKLCFEQQFLMIEHIRSFYPGASPRRAEERISNLVKAGFFKRSFYPETGRRAVFRLTDRGNSVAREADARSLTPIRYLNPKTLDHDAKVTSARLRLLQFWNASFIPERAIKTKKLPEVPDGLFFFPSGNGVALEIENSDKGQTRFLRLLDRWKETPSIVLVLFVVSHTRLHAVLLRYLQRATFETLIGVVRYDELIKDKPKIWTTRGERDLLSQREL